MAIYILPVAPDQFPPRFFEGKGIPWSGGNPEILFWNEFFDVCAKLGIAVRPYLSWDKSSRRDDDALLVLNHPGETFFWRTYYRLRYFRDGGGFMMEKRKFFWENYRYFGRRILMQLEPPVVMPYVFAHIDHLVASKIYDKMFFTSRLNRPQCLYFNYFEHRAKNIISPYFDDPKTKYLMMVNSNVRPHSLSGELYGERLRAIKFFSQFSDFDLYGFYWDLPVRHLLYPHYGKYVNRSWRGRISDKLKTVSEYKFSLCFENSIYPGWVSEKIFDCFAAGSIPIYFGAPDIESIVPAECFIDFRKFVNYNELNKFLRSRKERDMEAYRAAISRFLNKPMNSEKLEGFIRLCQTTH